MNLNKVFIIGNLTRDPELRSLPSGVPVVSFGVATNRVWKNQQGEKQEEVQFHNIVVFGKQAEIANQYLAKGRMVMIEGRLRTSNWEKDGVKHYRTEIISEQIQFGPRPAESGDFNRQSSQKFQANQKPDAQLKEELPQIDINEEDIKAEDLPF